MFLNKTRLLKSSLLLVALVIGQTAIGQDRKYVVGTAFELVGGGTNRLGNLIGSTNRSQPFFFFYGLYPSINITSSGAHTTWTGSYSFGMNRAETSTQLHSNSHAASLRLSDNLSERWKLGISDNFDMSDDVSTFNGLRGSVPVPEDFHFVFNPVANRITTKSNSANLSADYLMTDKSTLSFSTSHLIRNYDQPGINNSLSNQQAAFGAVQYRRKTSSRDSWSLGYTVSYYDFARFQDSLSHTALIGYSTILGRNTSLQFTVGPSYVRDLGSKTDYLGYSTNVTVQKTIENNQFAVFFNQGTGQSSGLGSISDTRSAGLSIGRVARRVRVFADVSAFDSNARLDNTYSTRGVAGTVTIGVPVARTLFFQGGVQYQHYDQSQPYGFDQKRAFISLRYDNPNLFKFSN